MNNIDHQNDNINLWAEIEPFWPEDLEKPEIGMSKSAHLIENSYPVDTPSDALASAMYFMLDKFASAVNSEELEMVCDDLDEYLDVYDLEIPEDFIDYAIGRNLEKVASFEEESEDYEEIYADENENLPITSPEQLVKSAELFVDNVDSWGHAERVLISYNLKVASIEHDVDLPVKLPFEDGGYESDLTKLAQAISARKRAMHDVNLAISSDCNEEELTKNASDAALYISSLDNVLAMDTLDAVSYLEELDVNFGMDQFWGRSYSSPSDAVMRKTASESKYQGVDFDVLRGVFEDGLVDAIKEDPETIINTLPAPQLDILNQHIGR